MALRWSAREWLWTAVLLAAAVPAMAADTPARRVVSSNLCADRLVLQLADRERVLSVSRFAADPAASTVAGLAAGIPVNRGNAEDIMTFHPDLVVLGAFDAHLTANMLRSLGIQVHVLPIAESVEEARTAIRGLAADLGVPERGERLVAEMDAGLAALPVRPHPTRAAIYQAGGWSAGRGTMADDLFGWIGLTNIAAEAGVSGFGALPLEALVASSPDLIVFENMGDDGPPSIAAELLRHPALSQGIRHVSVPMRLWACPDPALVDAAALIAGAAP
jgi:iron complex transport system substrate-binding protein